jgi:Ni/Fe-hydrogenase subunit HybB-like protein
MSHRDRYTDEIIDRGQSYDQVTRELIDLPREPGFRRGWLLGFAFSLLLFQVLVIAVVYLLVAGVGIWGINIPVAWGFAITNFVFWIGIGHAGTLISAILLLMRQDWRASINRFAEAMTLFAISVAALFPLLHLGRPEYFYWLFPYPNTLDLWPQFRSPLIIDVFAILTYALVSLMFWYMGLVPDLAAARDRERRPGRRKLYAFFALGWRGSARHWHRYQMTYLLLAALATPLVVSVHTVVSFDFATTLVPGWHSTIFPPYFVAGAIFSGLAMVVLITAALRRYYRLHGIITMKHLDNMAKIMLASGLFVSHGYVVEFFFGWYSGSEDHRYVLYDRAFGSYGLVFWQVIACNTVAPLVLFWKRARRSVPVLVVVSILVLYGMWIERYVIVIQSLHRDFMPSAWGSFSGTVWDYLTLAGSFGLFLTLLFLFVRLLPVSSAWELRELLHAGRRDEHA